MSPAVIPIARSCARGEACREPHGDGESYSHTDTQTQTHTKEYMTRARLHALHGGEQILDGAWNDALCALHIHVVTCRAHGEGLAGAWCVPSVARGHVRMVARDQQGWVGTCDTHGSTWGAFVILIRT